MMRNEEKLKQAVQISLNQSLDVKEGEKVLVIADDNTREIGDLFLEEAKKITFAEMIIIPAAKVHGEEPSDEAADKMLNYDVIIAATTKSLTHTNSLKAACEIRARAATLPGITEEILERAIPVDYEKMAGDTHKLKDLLDKGKEARVVSDNRTDIIFSIEGREAKAGTGVIRTKGDKGNLPAGEAYIAPVEGSAEGKFVIDGSVLDMRVSTPITVLVEKGHGVRITGGREADMLREELDKLSHKDAYNIAELGIGTNPKARITGKVLEDEKVKGTAHIALGKNSGFGGHVDIPIHLDGVFRRPTVYIDRKMIIDRGEFLI